MLCIYNDTPKKTITVYEFLCGIYITLRPPEAVQTVKLEALEGSPVGACGPCRKPELNEHHQKEKLPFVKKNVWYQRYMESFMNKRPCLW